MTQEQCAATQIFQFRPYSSSSVVVRPIELVNLKKLSLWYYGYHILLHTTNPLLILPDNNCIHVHT